MKPDVGIGYREVQSPPREQKAPCAEEKVRGSHIGCDNYILAFYQHNF